MTREKIILRSVESLKEKCGAIRLHRFKRVAVRGVCSLLPNEVQGQHSCISVPAPQGWLREVEGSQFTGRCFLPALLLQGRVAPLDTVVFWPTCVLFCTWRICAGGGPHEVAELVFCYITQNPESFALFFVRWKTCRVFIFFLFVKFEEDEKFGKFSFFEYCCIFWRNVLEGEVFWDATFIFFSAAGTRWARHHNGSQALMTLQHTTHQSPFLLHYLFILDFFGAFCKSLWITGVYKISFLQKTMWTIFECCTTWHNEL